jgi:HEAT repeat protein
MKQRTFGMIIGVLLVFVALGFVGVRLWIDTRIQKICDQALAHSASQVCVQALTQQVLDEDSSFADRNSAVWALGQMGDATALSALESVYTGEIPDREPWNETLSQYELQKAIQSLR